MWKIVYNLKQPLFAIHLNDNQKKNIAKYYARVRCVLTIYINSWRNYNKNIVKILILGNRTRATIYLNTTVIIKIRLKQLI